MLSKTILCIIKLQVVSHWSADGSVNSPLPLRKHSGDDSALDSHLSPAAGSVCGRTSEKLGGKWKWSPETHRGLTYQEPGQWSIKPTSFPRNSLMDVMACIKFLVSPVLDSGDPECHRKSEWIHTKPHTYYMWVSSLLLRSSFALHFSFS